MFLSESTRLSLCAHIQTHMYRHNHGDSSLRRARQKKSNAQHALWRKSSHESERDVPVKEDAAMGFMRVRAVCAYAENVPGGRCIKARRPTASSCSYDSVAVFIPW